jgi:DNA processing protein
MDEASLYAIALSMVPDIGSIRAKLLLDHFGDAAAIFKAKKKTLEAIEGIGSIVAQSIVHWKDLAFAEAELQYCADNEITVLHYYHPDYPNRLRHCYDAPAVLFYKGSADLNKQKVISIIGTRNNTNYGKAVTEELLEALQGMDILVTSGLAFGIDTIAHKAALQYQLETVGVLAHGIDSIYPSQHKSLAKEMMAHGGLLTEFPQGTKADRHNFPRRNRIVAGMTDATIVIETAEKGGSMITAELAWTYHRDLFAVPGKISDNKSAGCNQLIRQQKAQIYTSPKQLLKDMGWLNKPVKRQAQRLLFPELSETEQQIVALLQKADSLHIDLLYQQSGLSSSAVAAAMLNLEMQNIIISLPGKMFQLA